MAFLKVCALLAFVAVASAATNSSDVETLGAALPALLQKQWNAKLAQQAKNMTAAETALTANLTAVVKAGVQQAITELNAVETKIVANMTAFVKLQNTQATEIAKNYSTLLKTAAPSETAIHQLRQNAQATVNSWVPLLGQTHQDAHIAFEAAVRSLAVSVSNKTADRQVADQIRVAITEVGVQLLNVLVEEQNVDIFVLTSVQFNAYNQFFQQAESVMIEKMVAAKQNQQTASATPAAATPAAATPAATIQPSTV